MICWNIERINDLPAPMEPNHGLIKALFRPGWTITHIF